MSMNDTDKSHTQERGSGDGQDTLDAKPLPSTYVPAASKPSGETKAVSMGIDSLEIKKYKMDHQKRGMALIINNKIFSSHTNMGARNGSDEDAANLYQQFLSLQFQVEMKNDLSVKEMKNILISVSKMDHSVCDCFACAILSHGEEGVVYGTDGIVRLDALIEPLKGNICKSLAGKPKLFFIQACRGTKLDSGVLVTDANPNKSDPEKTFRIPSEADFLLAYSVVPGYYSWRNSTRGSWFIQALCNVLKKYGKSMELLKMLTIVNYSVAYEYESNASKEFMSKKKQIPCISSMLTKEVYFTPNLE